MVATPFMTVRRFALLVLLVAPVFTGCATPLFKDARWADLVPSDVQQSPDGVHGTEVLWGGRIVAFENREDSSEIEIVSYPIDRARQPVTDAPTQGRFILVLPGYVEAFDYPIGRHLTVHGALAGVRVGHVQEAEYVYPLVRGRTVHVWPWGFMLDRKPRVSIGVGVGIR